ncbi:MAG: aggregation factor core [Pseudomonadota bacterium]
MRSLLLFAPLVATPAPADLEIRFDEGAPKDRFTLSQTGDCTLGASEITIDLGGSAAGLIFDVTGTGAGVEVFQPFELTAGADQIASSPVVRDGDSAVVLSVTELAPDQSVAFTIDVDDTLGARAITVSDAEIAGATVSVRQGDRLLQATFDETASAQIAMPDCTS